MEKRIFLGGTCNGSKWRDELIPKLEERGWGYFNPVVDDWDEVAQRVEIYERKMCDFCLYVITPKMLGVYSIAEAVDDSNKRPLKTIFVIHDDDTDEDGHFLPFQTDSLAQIGWMISKNGGMFFPNMKSFIRQL